MYSISRWEFQQFRTPSHHPRGRHVAKPEKNGKNYLYTHHSVVLLISHCNQTSIIFNYHQFLQVTGKGTQWRIVSFQTITVFQIFQSFCTFSVPRTGQSSGDLSLEWLFWNFVVQIDSSSDQKRPIFRMIKLHTTHLCRIMNPSWTRW